MAKRGVGANGDASPINHADRRTAIKLLGGTALVTAGGAAGIAALSESAKAQAETNVALDDGEYRLNEDGTVEDVLLKGNLSGSFESPDDSIVRTKFVVVLDHADQDDRTAKQWSIDVEPDDPHSASVETDSDVSLIHDWSFEPADFDPGPGETVRYEFRMDVNFELYDSMASGATPIAHVQDTDTGRVIVERIDENSSENVDPTISFVGAEMQFQIVA